MEGKEMRTGEERKRGGKEKKRKKRACMSSQAGSVRPLCHVSQLQPLHTHTFFFSHDGHVLSVAHPLSQSHTHTNDHFTHTNISSLLLQDHSDKGSAAAWPNRLSVGSQLR